MTVCGLTVAFAEANFCPEKLLDSARKPSIATRPSRQPIIFRSRLGVPSPHHFSSADHRRLRVRCIRLRVVPAYKYTPYYQYGQLSKSEPMREELSGEDVLYRLEFIAGDIDAYFEDVAAQIAVSADGIVSVTTDLLQKDCDDRVKRCLNSLDLFARKIPC